jgi:hypothetical protein
MVVMGRAKFLAALSIGIGLMVPLLVAEVVLRFLPVQTGLQTLPVNDQNPVRRFAPNREFTFSREWNFKLVNKGRTNNFGFVNDQNYDSTARTPLVAVIGDSYVEAQMVPFRETLQGRLSQCVGSRGRVYSFAASGAPLSAYLAEASYARSKFRPDGIVVVIVGNDFDESLARYRTGPGSYYFREDSTGLVLHRTDYSPSLGRRILRQSALVRYLTLNLGGGVAKVKRVLQGQSMVDPQYVGNTAAAFTPERLQDSRQAVDEFLTLLPSHSGVDPAHTVLVIDAMRPAMYDEQGLREASGSFFDLMRRYVIEQGQRRGYEMVDMESRFLHRYALDGQRFESPSDHHWNGLGHEEAANAVAASKTFAKVFPGSCPTLVREGELVARP